MPLGFVAVLAGWITTEVGRQPWTVYGLLRTADSVTPSLTGHDVALSLAGYVVVYLIMYPVGVVLMAPAGQRGPRGGARRIRSRAAAPRARSPARARDGAMTEVLDFVPIWTLILGLAVFLYVLLDGFDLGVGMLFGFAPDTAVAQPDHELDRADLGRQRDLAGARRPRALRRLPARLRHHHPGGLLPDPR